MADHRIGLNLDVRNTTALDRLQSEFRDIGDAADQIRARFERLDQFSNRMMRNGIGSANYTRELRDQLNLVQQMARVYENEARRTGNAGALQSLQSSRASMGNLNGELSAYGSIQSSSPLSKLGNIGKLTGLSALATLSAIPVSMMRTGYSTALNLLPSLANFSQTMTATPGTATNAWAYNMLNSANGYGYNYSDILNGANTLKGATGQTSNFNQYMQGIAQFGRYNGFDFNQASQYFSQNYQNGGNLSPLQYATLVAQTVNTANMQGRNGQVAEAINQLTAQSSQMSLSANTQQISQLYATGASSGNQAWKNNLVQVLSSVNSGIANPGGGVMGQAMVMQSLMGGFSPQDRNYFGEQMLQSGGAFTSPFKVFGRGSKETNFQRYLTDAYKQYGGNTEAADVSLGQVLNINSIDARKLMSTYMKGGKFQEADFTKNKSKVEAEIKGSGNAPNNSLDTTLKNLTTATNNFTKAASPLVKAMGQFEKALGAHPDVSAGTGAVASGLAGAGIFASLFGGSKLLRPVTRGATSLLGRVGGWAKGLLGRSLTGDAVAGGLDATGTALELGGTAADATGVGAIGGIPANILGALLLTGGAAMTGVGLLGKHNSSSKSSSSTSAKLPTDIQSEVANVVAVLMALRPYSTQIHQWFNTSSSFTGGSSSSLFSLGNASTSSSSLIQNIPNAKPITSSGGLMNAVYNPSGGSSNGSSSSSSYYGPAGSSYSGSGSASSYTNSLKPYALQAAKQLGVPAQYQNQVAQFILAQWGFESSNATSHDAHADDNLAGIKYYPGMSVGSKGIAASDGGNYAHFSSLGQFATGYADFLKGNSYYSSIVSGARSGDSASELAKLIAYSPYAGNNGTSYYNGVMAHLNANAPYYGSAPSNVKVTVSAKPVTITVKSPSGSGSKTIKFNTTTAVHQF